LHKTLIIQHIAKPTYRRQMKQ